MTPKQLMRIAMSTNDANNIESLVDQAREFLDKVEDFLTEAYGWSAYGRAQCADIIKYKEDDKAFYNAFLNWAARYCFTNRK